MISSDTQYPPGHATHHVMSYLLFVMYVGIIRCVRVGVGVGSQGSLLGCAPDLSGRHPYELNPVWQ